MQDSSRLPCLFDPSCAHSGHPAQPWRQEPTGCCSAGAPATCWHACAWRGLRTEVLTASASSRPGVSTIVSVKPAATRENAVALLVSLCMAATGATCSAKMLLAVLLLPTPVLPARMRHCAAHAPCLVRPLRDTVRSQQRDIVHAHWLLALHAQRSPCMRAASPSMSMVSLVFF